MGQLGTELAKILRAKYGRDNVIMSDIIKPSKAIVESGPYIFADILDFKCLQEVVVTYRIDWLVHFSALLSAVGEQNVPLAIRVNIEGMHNVMELAKQYRLKIFVPSTIGAFGPDSPRNPTPNVTVQRPRTIYGVSKVHAELLGEYYHKRPYIFADILDFKCLQEVVVTYRIDWLVHFSALLSAVGEQNVPLAIRVNIEGMHNVMELAKQYRLKIFVPSTIGAFGPDSPRNPTPNVTVQRPRTIYGVSKVHAELLGEYYHKHYAVQIFHDALRTGQYECYLRPDTRLPMIYIEDCLRALWEIMVAPVEQLKTRTYNVTAMSFTPAELADALRKQVPGLEVSYRPDGRQHIADSWPEVFDDSEARRDWGWGHKYDLDEMCRVMVNNIRANTKA
ncbi:hypothetical protein B566_EDAN013955 [Ephemera danica]|nr:hypothetical protein B566_EDAN013955 [Ephemera danica]